MITLKSLRKGADWRSFFSTREKTYPKFLSEDVQSTFSGLIDRNKAGSLYIPQDLPVALPPFSSLILPEMDAPIKLYPNLHLLSDDEIQNIVTGLARMLPLVTPDISMNWNDKAKITEVILDLCKSLIEELNRYSTLHGDSVMVSITGCDKDNLLLSIETTVQNILSFVYLEEKNMLDSRARRLSGLFDEAIRLLGTVCRAWDDIQINALDYYENCVLPELEVPGVYDEEDIRTYKNNYVQIKAHPATSFFSSIRLKPKKRLERLWKEVNCIRPKNDLEKIYWHWFKDVIGLIEDKPFDAFNTILNCYDEGSLPPLLMFSILYDFEDRDPVSKYYCEEIDNAMQNGCYKNIICNIEIPLKNDKGMKQEVKKLKHVLRVLSRLCRIFGFFQERKE